MQLRLRLKGMERTDERRRQHHIAHAAEPNYQEMPSCHT
jgi:hypothetical protein